MKKQKIRRFRKTLRKFERLINVQLKICCAEVTLAQCHVLLEVEDKGQTTTGEIAKHLNLEKSTVSRTIDDLVNGGLLKRVPHPSDRRYVLIELSDRGKMTCDSINRLNDEYFGKILGSIPEDKIDPILKYFDLLVNIFEDFEDKRQDAVKCCNSADERISAR
ncbi:MAG: MarR family transcriptional regulator [Candidatus Aminicenantes bacterium]|nr:MarR family transcriptional regulator [Candidatus Aminicenantes bacterium]